MSTSNLIAYASPSLWIWGINVFLLVVVVVLFLVQYGFSRTNNEPAVRNVCYVMTVVGILMSIIAMAFVIVNASVIRESRNIATDPSGLFVSRHDLLVNWFNDVTWVGGTYDLKSSISAEDPQDGGKICTENLTSTASEASFAEYRSLIKAFEGGGHVTQSYYTVPDGSSTKLVPQDLHYQQMLTLAFYRQSYCMKERWKNVLEGKAGSLKWVLNDQQIQRLNQRLPCTTAHVQPDTIACLKPDWPDTALPLSQCGDDRNQCYDALVDSITAQCLLYDDGVTARISGGTPVGSLKAFGLTGFRVYGPGSS